jgi:hypothetical protein
MARAYVLVGIDIPDSLDPSPQRRTVAEILQMLLREALAARGLEASCSTIGFTPDDVDRMTYALRKYAERSAAEDREQDAALQEKLVEIKRTVDQIVAQRSQR